MEAQDKTKAITKIVFFIIILLFLRWCDMEQNSKKLTPEDIFSTAKYFLTEIEAKVQGDRNLLELVLQQMSWIGRTSFVISGSTPTPDFLPPPA